MTPAQKHPTLPGVLLFPGNGPMIFYFYFFVSFQKQICSLQARRKLLPILSDRYWAVGFRSKMWMEGEGLRGGRCEEDEIAEAGEERKTLECVGSAGGDDIFYLMLITSQTFRVQNAVCCSGLASCHLSVRLAPSHQG